jgi:molybdopterin/thiamine biosynthesis adenylyltransferase
MLSDAQIERWSRQILVPQVGGRGQLRLLGARVALEGRGPVARQCADLLARAGVPVGAADASGPADVVVDLRDTAAPRHEAATGAPLVRGRLAGCAGLLDTLVGRPCARCLDPALRSSADDAGPLAAAAAQTLAALAAAEVLRVLLEPAPAARRLRFDLTSGAFDCTPLPTTSGCGCCREPG